MSTSQYETKEQIRTFLRGKYGVEWSKNDTAQAEKTALYDDLSARHRAAAKERRAAEKAAKTAKTADADAPAKTAPAQETAPIQETSAQGVIVINVRKADLKKMVEWIAAAPANIHFHIR